AVLGALPDEGEAPAAGPASFSIPTENPDEPLAVLCPGCRKTFKVPPRLLTGPKIRCPLCETAFAPAFRAQTILAGQPRATRATQKPEPATPTRRTEVLRPSGGRPKPAAVPEPPNRLPPWAFWGIGAGAAALLAVLGLVLFLSALPRSPTQARIT